MADPTLPMGTPPDPITELVRLRAWVALLSHQVDGIGELPARQRGIEASRIAERMRARVSEQTVVEAMPHEQ